MKTSGKIRRSTTLSLGFLYTIVHIHLLYKSLFTYLFIQCLMFYIIYLVSTL